MISEQRNRKRGAALVEFSLVATLLLLLAAGAGDFGRIFTEAIAVKSGSATAALYGSQRIARTGDAAGMQAKAEAEADASDAGAVTVTAAQYCTCPAGNGTSNWTEIPCEDFSATTCNNAYGSPRAYIQVNATKNFTTVIKMPGVPTGTTINQTTWMRVR